MSASRAHKSILNSIYSFIFYLLGIGITFFSRRFYFDALGADVSGMNTSIGSFLSMLSIAELGIGGAVAYMLYKPLNEKDSTTINEIISLQGWFYRRILMLVMVVASVLLCFFPYIFRKFEGPLWYTYATFLTFFMGMVMSYVVNYRIIIFDADQRGYRLTMFSQGGATVKSLLQIVILYYIENPYSYYLLMELLYIFTFTFGIEIMVKKDYPWLKTNLKEGKTYLKKYPEVTTKVKQLFVHRLTYIGLMNASPLIMTTLISFATIGYYSNYIVLMSNLGVIIGSLVNNLSAGIGSLIAEGNHSKTMKFFWEHLALKNFLGASVAFGIFCFASKLIPLWMGNNPDYILSVDVVFWIACFAYINTSRGTLDAFLYGKGMFNDMWASVVDCILNISFSFIGGYFWGLPGIVAGGVLSYIFIPIIWKSVFLFRDGFELSPWLYIKNYLPYPFIALATIALANYTIEYLSWDFSTIPRFLLNGLIIGIGYLAILFAVYFVISQGFRDLVYRVSDLVANVYRTKFAKG